MLQFYTTFLALDTQHTKREREIDNIQARQEQRSRFKTKFKNDPFFFLKRR